jgi:hypothetical protein
VHFLPFANFFKISDQKSLHKNQILQVGDEIIVISKYNPIISNYPLNPINHVQALYSAKHSVTDDLAFPWEHAIFRYPQDENPLTNRSEILQSSLRQGDH